MFDLYEIYNKPEKLIWYNEYASLIKELIYSGEDYKVMRRCDAILHIIKKSPSAAYVYAHYVLGERWPEAERYILTYPEWTFHYAVNVIKDRWIEAEPILINYPHWAYMYARHMIKGRWIGAEKYIIQKPSTAYFYAKYVLKSRWEKAEECIKASDTWWPEYATYFKL